MKIKHFQIAALTGLMAFAGFASADIFKRDNANNSQMFFSYIKNFISHSIFLLRPMLIFLHNV